MEKLPISVVMITKNEAHNIERALNSVAFCNEIIVVDSGSTDGTPDLARGLGAKVLITENWPGFGPQKNRALAEVTQPWFLSLDADEWVSPELHKSIAKHLDSNQPAQFLRRSSFCGKFMRFSGWGDDWIVRLAKKGAAKFSDDLVHEKLIFEDMPKSLNGLLFHESFRDTKQVLEKINFYSELWAEQAFNKNKKSSLLKAIMKSFAAFVKTYLFKQGFRDGKHGLLLSYTNAHGTFYKYMKLWLKNAN